MSSNATIKISLERLQELEYIERNYSTIVAMCATQIIIEQMEAQPSTNTVAKNVSSKKKDQNKE